jgi:CRISPR-associated endonuclease/helicase Cas3
MSRGVSRAERLQEMERLYLQRAYSDIEMADRLSTPAHKVDRTTVYRDRIALETRIPLSQDDDGRYRIDLVRYLPAIRVDLREALSLYLAARRASQQTHSAQKHTASALEKLALTLKQPMAARLVQAADVILRQKASPERDKVFEVAADAWVQGLRLRVSYQGLQAKLPYEDVISPYLIEPSPWSDSVYVIGPSDRLNKIVPYKLDRIQHVALTSERFALPEDFDEQELLRHAWGIWRGEGEPVTVKLKFAAGEAARRVQESVWHPLEQVTLTEDGGCLWQAPIAEPREMLPWVRGWGSEVEALEPVELRDLMTNEAAHLFMRYLVSLPDTSAAPPHRLLWAKADRKMNMVHRLIFHMVDVGLTAQTVWEHALHSRLKLQLADWLGLTLEEAGRLIAFLASLHDLGKASPAFQDHPRMPASLKSQIMTDLRAAGFAFRENRPPNAKHTRHEVLSTWSLRSVEGERLLCAVGELPADLAGLIAQALGGHHGAWPRADRFGPSNLTYSDKGGDEWATARAELVKEMKQVFQPPAVAAFQPDTTRDNVRLTLLSAIFAAADWIGSDETRFPFEEQLLPLRSYVRHARLHAECAVKSIGWEPPAAMPEFVFEGVFPFPQNDTQQGIIAALKHVPLPALAIIEAPMGLGKTEAAFGAYADWAKQCRAAGLYVAMPTTATSNQMHDRTKKFLSKQMGETVTPLLVHSQALLRDLPEQDDPVEEDDGDAAAAQAWFLPRKKSLLAPYGVGTVDQALMSVLQTKHFFVRLLGLSHKVVIFDEVHAYDAYMSELFERLLIWLRAVDASVIVLSATLPEKTRWKLVAAYAAGGKTPPACRYPRLTFADADGKVDAIPLAPPPAKTLRYDWLPRDVDTIVEKLREKLSNGGCAAVICNTVTRAQEIFQAIQKQEGEEKLCDDDNLILFHARFPMAWREKIEQKVLCMFGPGLEKGKPNPDRPRRAIVVATQVIEQSLDLDFDVMTSDLAPVDLLLQRSGRLHRHRVNDRRGHDNCLWIAEPLVKDGLPQFDRSDTYVYQEYVLLRSWLALRGHKLPEIAIPQEVPELIEEVYGEQQIPTTDPRLTKVLENAKAEMIKDEIKAEDIAEERLVFEPNAKKLLRQPNMALGEEDDPELSPAFRALTRLGDPGVQVICLHRVDNELHLEPDGSDVAIDPNAQMGKSTILRLARHSISVRHPDSIVGTALLNLDTDSLVGAMLRRWKRIAALRFCRAMVFEQGAYQLPGTPYVLDLDRTLGLRITKEI